VQNNEVQSVTISKFAALINARKSHKSVEYFKIRHKLATKTGNAEDKGKPCLNKRKIRYETPQKI
jgi:hypothetical protein